MWLEAVPVAEGDACQCPTCGGYVRKRAFGEMHAGSYVLDGKRVEVRRAPREGFANPIYLDPLTQYFDGGLYRLWPSERYFARGGAKLHRAVWASAFGDIPRGCHIHHRDGNAANNAIDNLECLPASEHLRLPTGRAGSISDKARAAAAEWHRSEEGRLWHKRHAERTKSWTKWERHPKNCLTCGNEFQALVRKNGREQKFCHANCKATYHRRRRASLANG